MRKGVSIIVCCYNSSLRLPETIKHIARQVVSSDIKWEVIIVNNASTDNTSIIATKEWSKYSCKVDFKIVDQPIPGLSAARTKGIDVSNFEYLLFCDDDNWLDENYVTIAFKTMESHPDAGIVGGQSEGFFEIEKPFWFDTFSQSYVVEKPFLKSCYLPKEREYLAGAGLIIRKSIIKLLNEMKFSPILTGRIGKSLMSGEDYELCLITKFLGFRIYYDKNLKLTHYMPANRLNWSYCLKMITYGHAIPEIYFDTYKVLFYDYKKSAQRFHIRLIYNCLLEIFKPESISFKAIILIFLNFKYYIKLYPGSLEQRKLLSARNKIFYLIKKKKSYYQQFEIIKLLIERIKEFNINKYNNLKSDL